jgi:hypothetical protein
MIIKALYSDGRIQTMNIAYGDSTSDPFAIERDTKAATLATELVVRGDELLTKGLCVDYNWYSSVIDKDTEEYTGEYYSKPLRLAAREAGRRICCIAPEEMDSIERIVVNGDVLAWREGGVLFNGVKFLEAQDHYCRKDNSSQAENAIKLYEVFTNLYPGATHQEVCAMFGYTPELYDKALIVATAFVAADDMIDEVSDSTPEDKMP